MVDICHQQSHGHVFSVKSAVDDQTNVSTADYTDTQRMSLSVSIDLLLYGLMETSAVTAHGFIIGLVRDLVISKRCVYVWVCFKVKMNE